MTHVTDAQIAKALWIHGNRRTEAAKDLGIQHWRVQKYAEDHRIPPAWVQHPPSKNSKESQILQALAEHGNDRKAASKAIGANIKTVERWARYHRIPLPMRDKVKRKAPERSVILWNDENVSKLRDLCLQARARRRRKWRIFFNTTASAIQIVLSRKGLIRNAATTGAAWKNEKRPRNCICCRKPFVSEGSHNRQCPVCYAANSEMAA